MSSLSPHFSLALGFPPLLQALNVTKGLLLDDFKFFDHFFVLEIYVGLLSHVQHLLRRPAEVHVHDPDEVLLRKFDLLNRRFVNANLLNLIEFPRQLVVLDALVNDLSQLINLGEVLQLVLNMERKLLYLLLDKEVHFSVNFLHLQLDLFVLYRLGLAYTYWLGKLFLQVFSHRNWHLLLLLSRRCCGFDFVSASS